MLSKKYPKEEWNVSSAVLWMRNVTDPEIKGARGIWIAFLVEVEPQMSNTSRVVRNLAKSFFFFNNLGSLQIEPTTVIFKGESQGSGVDGPRRTSRDRPPAHSGKLTHYTIQRCAVRARLNHGSGLAESSGAPNSR